jgi:UDP-N-acetylmuramoyl-L-alanyl-D-glutamate--2,6-diaminopimelate ligase
LPSGRALHVSGLALDSRRVQPGDLFIARAGSHQRGADFIAEALQRGAVAVMAQRGELSEAERAALSVPLLEVDELDSMAGQVASRFHGRPSGQLRVIGITGTNGKTSCSFYLAQALESLGHRCAVIGTLGSGFIAELEPATHTTPDPITLQARLARLRRQGAEYVVMEVSSHALEQKRVAGVEFAAAGFTNLTRDHLDYHGDMARYGGAKARLFVDHAPPLQAFNLEDRFGRSLYERQLTTPARVLGFALAAGPGIDLSASQLQFDQHGCRFDLRTPAGRQRIESVLLGRFNVSNLLLCATLLQLLGFGPEAIATALGRLEPVAGRMQCLPRGEGQPQVVIDYAHTPDALAQALQALRLHRPGRGLLWCVFGCGGERDRGKRPEMGAVAARLADRLVVTSDNPRGEPAQQIIREVQAGIPTTAPLHLEVERGRAIRWAIRHAGPDDLVLIAGKGHENYQEIEGVRHPFSDHEHATSALQQEAEV